MKTTTRRISRTVKRVCTLALFMAALLCLGVYAGRTYDTKVSEDFKNNYQVYSLPIPESIQFAGTAISLSDPDAAERFDRELLTNVYWQSQSILLIKRAAKFMPRIEQILKENNIPSDFKYLALAESGLQLVVSPAGAAGYWQFLDKTGKHYGLEITEEVDQRYDIEKSTWAACAYFRESYAVFHNWPMVAASYNMGIEGLRKQIMYQEVMNYEDLYLNTETSRYLFRVLAIKELVENPTKYGFNVPYSHLYKEPATVKVEVNLSISDLPKWALQNACNYKVLKNLNPWIRKSFLNVAPGSAYEIKLPADKIMASPLASKVLNGYLKLDDTRMDSMPKQDVMKVIEHKVTSGETLQSIAKKYGVDLQELLDWNELTKVVPLKIGSTIFIHSKVEEDLSNGN